MSFTRFLSTSMLSYAAGTIEKVKSPIKLATAILILFVAGPIYAQSCSGMALGNNANLNGFVPFPSTNAWNTNIASAPVDPNSAAMTAAPGFAGLYLHPDFGSTDGIPYVVVDSTVTPSTPINVIDYAGQSDVVLAPYPSTTPIEGAPVDCSGWPDTYLGDTHTLVLDRAKCVLYETFNTNRCNGQLDASSETIWDMNSTESRPVGWTSADAAGLPIFPGLVRYDEIASGVINHAIRFTMAQTKLDNNGGYFVSPASHASGNLWGSKNVMGMRIRLKASFDISGYSAVNKVILTAMKNYGMILADNGGYFFFQGVADPRFNDDDLSKLKGIASSNFDVVQSTPEFPGYDSETAPTGAAPVINSFAASVSSVSSGSPVTFNYNVTGDSYDFIDMIGPVEVGSGSVTVNPTATQTYTLNSTNAYGRTTSTPITITVPGSVVVPPIFTPSAGSYPVAQTITISTATSPAATIYYTTDGTTPTTSSPIFSIYSPIVVSASETVKAIAVATGYSVPSAVASAVYAIGSSVASTPSFSLASGTYTAAQTVSISDTTAGATIYYTTNGTTPTTSSAVYSGAITVSSTETIQAIAVATGFTSSAVSSSTYTINLLTAAPVLSVAAGTYTSVQSVNISDATSGATIYYTTNGATPTTSSAVYSGAITVSSTETIQAIAIATGCTSSAVTSAAYTINLPAAAPILSVAAGTYTSVQTVSISDATSGATIHYTTNGTTPTANSAVYSGAITVSSTETIEAIALASGYTNSAVTSAAYTINLPTATPVFSVSSGTYTTAQTVSLSDAMAGATIYYTTNGTTPTTSSIVYSSPIAVPLAQAFQAMAVAPGYSNSATATAAYVIIVPPTAVTTAATAITTSTVQLNATVNSLGLPGTYTFQYGPSTSLPNASTAATVLSSSTSSRAASAQLTGLKTKTSYSYRVIVTTAGGTVRGALLTFTTN